MLSSVLLSVTVCGRISLAIDPFLGAGTTTVAAAKWGRNSIGYEIDEHYYELALERIKRETSSLFSKTEIRERR